MEIIDFLQSDELLKELQLACCGVIIFCCYFGIFYYFKQSLHNANLLVAGFRSYRPLNC